ncbi:MAG: lipoprotein signal peptidase [Saprospiraceae bacterium]|nr:lipoprotein signal peptidase [Saprospiraceae bacterium]HMW38308.1 lipoprotein signal peptidase [Saprospiraceae bacterium]HMX88149.1 lipoprotein signal peptidase [Saprospiraceae bacterium]HMZ39888.1 lipoprotein signal peptidase [Saprospiraceae bacterium]HNA64428.1 lipoprotein signal peptidase [Saprospiraceae bacterium]
MKRNLLLTFGIILMVLILDQTLKIWVKTHMQQGDEFLLFGQSWARIHFIENEGMAFGLNLGGATGKLLLSTFRILAIGFLGYLLAGMIRHGERVGMVISFALILAGAIGNMIDSAFYGIIFSNSSYHGGLAELFPPEGGYAPFLMGRVVDMFYFPMVESTFPTWFPVWGGEEFEFFRHIFNVADSSIFCGIVLFFVFYRGRHPHKVEVDNHGEGSSEATV